MGQTGCKSSRATYNYSGGWAGTCMRVGSGLHVGTVVATCNMSELGDLGERAPQRSSVFSSAMTCLRFLLVLACLASAGAFAALPARAFAAAQHRPAAAAAVGMTAATKPQRVNERNRVYNKGYRSEMRTRIKNVSARAPSDSTLRTRARARARRRGRPWHRKELAPTPVPRPPPSPLAQRARLCSGASPVCN